MAEGTTPELRFGRGGLGPGEKFWRKLYPWLSERGFQLRRRYSPDWVPSFSKLGPDRPYRYKQFEDGPELLVSHQRTIGFL